jgi:hypothetical protein
MTTRQIILQSRPVGTPTLQNFKLENTTLDQLQPEGAKRTLLYSRIPYRHDAKYVARFR